MLHILSLGAGVQSSTLALMAAHGEVTPMPDHAIFADTGAEPKRVYEWLDWLETKLPYPVHRVMHKAGLLEGLKSGERCASPPFFTEGGGLLWRQCTQDFKIAPIRRKVKELGEAIIWQGISLDEVQRARQDCRYPLIEKRMTRSDCLRWMAGHDYPMPGKSSCTFCPYHDDAHWRDMKLNDKASWDQAVEVDEMIRGGVRGTTQKLFLHRSLKPLVDVDFRNAEDFGQIDAFAEECEGMCGL